MSHPISPRVPSLFVPVRDLKLATEWYANLLERHIVPKDHEDGIYIFDFDGTEVILDSNAWGSPSTIMFDTKDIAAAYDFCAGQQYDTLTDVFSDEYISVFTVNSNLMCQAHRLPETAKTKQAHALLSKIGHILIHTGTLNETVQWYETLVARTAEPDARFPELRCIRMEKGAHLLFDDNRLCESGKPICIIETPDLEAALAHVQAKGATVARGLEARMGVRCFAFGDPDGNEFIVCQTGV